MTSMPDVVMATLTPVASINGVGFAFTTYSDVWRAMKERKNMTPTHLSSRFPIACVPDEDSAEIKRTGIHEAQQDTPYSEWKESGRTMATTKQFLSRPEIRALKQRVRQQTDADAAIVLLADSVQKEHHRLALHRFCVAFVLDESRTKCFAPYCSQIAEFLSPAEVQRIINHVNKDIHAMVLSSLGDYRA